MIRLRIHEHNFVSEERVNKWNVKIKQFGFYEAVCILQTTLYLIHKFMELIGGFIRPLTLDQKVLNLNCAYHGSCVIG